MAPIVSNHLVSKICQAVKQLQTGHIERRVQRPLHEQWSNIELLGHDLHETDADFLVIEENAVDDRRGSTPSGKQTRMNVQDATVQKSSRLGC